MSPEAIISDASYLNGSSLDSIQPLKVNFTIEKPSSVNISNSKITLSNFNSEYIDFSKMKLSNGNLTDSFGTLSYNADLGEIYYTFNSGISESNSAKINISILIYGNELNSNSPNQTISGKYTNSSGVSSSIAITNPTYFVTKKDSGTAHTNKNMVQGPGVLLYTTGDGQLIQNFAGSIPDTINGGVRPTFYPNSQYMSLTNRFDPYNVTINDIGRKYTFTVSGSAEIDTNKIIVTRNSTSGKWYTLDDYFAKNNLGTYSLSSDKKSLTLSYKDGVSFSNDSFNMNLFTPNLSEIYTTTWNYTADTVNAVETVQTHTARPSFIQSGSSGFIPLITASDKYINSSTSIENINQWLLDGVTANDVEDGNITNQVTISDDGGFYESWESKKSGVYQVTYSVTDSSENTVTKTINVTIYSDITVHYQD